MRIAPISGLCLSLTPSAAAITKRVVPPRRATMSVRRVLVTLVPIALLAGCSTMGPKQQSPVEKAALPPAPPPAVLIPSIERLLENLSKFPPEVLKNTSRYLSAMSVGDPTPCKLTGNPGHLQCPSKIIIITGTLSGQNVCIAQ